MMYYSVILSNDNIAQEDYDKLEQTAKITYDAPLQVKHFDHDNFQVFQYSQTLLVHEIVVTHLVEFEKQSGGRVAWMALLVRFKGDDARNVAIALAHETIHMTTYEKKSHHFIFDDIVTII